MPADPARAPLADASERLRRKPGRPRTRPERPPSTRVEVSAIIPLRPRLADREAAARYLSVSTDVVDHYDARGVLHRVRLPGPDGANLRKVLYDVAELDFLVRRCSSIDPPPPIGRAGGTANGVR